jgi:adenine-specific DNA-methyltransferase
LAAPGGQIVAIIPRSFCNGPYYRPFREFIFKRSAIQHIHLFESRDQAFKDDDVLQENIIIRLERDARQGAVIVSTSTDDRFVDLSSYEYPFKEIVCPDDSEKFIHVPTIVDKSFSFPSEICWSLIDVGISVSTGPVVDFRLKEHLRDLPEVGSVPLFYPAHFSSGSMVWPKLGMKKPNAIHCNIDTEKWLYPSGFYCVVRRFSSKEEKRRIVASIIDPSVLGDASMLGFENHLNLFHENKKGLPQYLAVFLNSTIVDENFRRFSGHTQVNATDLRQMKYPSRSCLIELGQWATNCSGLTQLMIDEKLGAFS